MQGYYEQLLAQYGDLSMVPAIRAGKALTNEDSAIWHGLMYKSRTAGDGFRAQAVRIMDQGRELTPFRA